jgi:UPF0755 protein
MRRGWLALGLLAVALGAGAWIGGRALQRQMDQPQQNAGPVRIVVQPGMGLRAILTVLRHQGVLRHPRFIELYMRLHRESLRARAGIYEIAPRATPRHIIEQLVEGRVLLESITVVEGWSFAQMRQAVDAQPDIAHQLRGLSDAALMQVLGHPGEAPEGRFFPDTYRFAAGTQDRKIFELAYRRMQSTLEEVWAHRDPDLPLATPAEGLTLASIIEKETARTDERSKVAAVFLNRLRRGMRLQADPTVIYGLGARYDGSIHTRDLETDTPYNTYTRTGLPPTPISLPGAASLQAALHPASIDALYFVATGAGDGSHQFSDTLTEQDVALRSYLHHLGVATGTRGANGKGGAHEGGSSSGNKGNSTGNTTGSSTGSSTGGRTGGGAACCRTGAGGPSS